MNFNWLNSSRLHDVSIAIIGTYPTGPPPISDCFLMKDPTGPPLLKSEYCLKPSSTPPLDLIPEFLQRFHITNLACAIAELLCRVLLVYNSYCMIFWFAFAQEDLEFIDWLIIKKSQLTCQRVQAMHGNLRLFTYDHILEILYLRDVPRRRIWRQHVVFAVGYGIKQCQLSRMTMWPFRLSSACSEVFFVGYEARFVAYLCDCPNLQQTQTWQ
ncbi:hypothetical protein BU25DRAFT_148562 [Macroventuria anomochaeta]|uniref:Uncharacterized protein n=1 Tax=Macroventuria anomochaeta TaxID=301207 RepID=A0ACB6SG42_9PLEO|nr:uncharacterized protein BU25DRAFT_148562 [Macroventuria anomochaeta]KAF2632303.1 hypothetical protein BU25DRAFT_148562 [Macroventuria anomochaeta]